jgi:hypothetical protein
MMSQSVFNLGCFHRPRRDISFHLKRLLSTSSRIGYYRANAHPFKIGRQEEAYGAVAPLHRPENFAELQRIADEEREDRWLSKADQ